jgi:hypothetical protein
METQTEKIASESATESNSKRITEFKKFCRENKIIQQDIREKTALSIGCIHSMWTEGKATPSTVKLLYLTYGKKYKLTEESIHQMIKNFV